MRARKALSLPSRSVAVEDGSPPETAAGSSVGQELEKGPLKGLRASGGLQGRLRREPREGGSGERKCRRLVEDEASSHSDSG